MRQRSKILTMALSAALVFPLLPVASHAQSSDSSVQPELARKAAASVLIDSVQSGEAAGWSTSTRVGVAEDVYDPAGQHVAYLVSFYQPSGQDAGYALISANQDEEPVLLWSAGDDAISEPQAEQAAMNELEREQPSLVAPTAKDSKRVWYGGVNLGVEVESSTGESIAVDQSLRAAMVTEDAADPNVNAYPAPTYSPDNREKWQRIEGITMSAAGDSDTDGVTSIDPATWEPTYNRIEKYYINGVTSMKQWNYTAGQASGCSPTAGSNIIMWFAKQYPALNPTGNQRDIVMALRGTMNTKQNSNGEGITAPYDINNGLQNYMRSHGVPTAVSKNTNLAAYTEYRTRIEGGAPVLQSYWDQPYFGDHTVTVVGYKQLVRGTPTTSSNYLVVKNNWASDTSDLYVKFGTWNTNVMTYTYVNGS